MSGIFATKKTITKIDMSKLVHDQRWQDFRSAINKADCLRFFHSYLDSHPVRFSIHFKKSKVQPIVQSPFTLKYKQTSLDLWVWKYTWSENILENFGSAINKPDCLKFCHSYLGSHPVRLLIHTKKSKIQPMVNYFCESDWLALSHRSMKICQRQLIGYE